MDDKDIKINNSEVSRVKLCPDGKYRWLYEFNMLKNPTILFTVFRVMGMSFAITAMIVLMIGACSGNLSSFKLEWSDLKGFLIFTAVFSVLIILAYLMVANRYDNKYIVLFEMDETGVVHKQFPKTVKKAKAIGMLNVLAGLAAGSPGSVGRGLLIASHTSLTSSFNSVRKVKPIRRYNVIKVDELLTRNQIYVVDEDFDFVYNYILSHCPRLQS